MSKFEEIKDYINDEMDDEQIVKLYNNYCEANNYERVYTMDDMDELLDSYSPWEVARACYFGDFCPTHDYWEFNGYGNLHSYYNAYDVVRTKVDVDAIANYIVENEDSLGDDDIQEILDNDEEE